MSQHRCKTSSKTDSVCRCGQTLALVSYMHFLVCISFIHGSLGIFLVLISRLCCEIHAVWENSVYQTVVQKHQPFICNPKTHTELNSLLENGSFTLGALFSSKTSSVCCFYLISCVMWCLHSWQSKHIVGYELRMREESFVRAVSSVWSEGTLL